jgi:phosphate transport system permease protein
LDQPDGGKADIDLAQVRTVDRIYKYVSGVVASSALVLLAVAFAVLLYYAYPSILLNGTDFFRGTNWNAQLGGNVIVVNGIRTISGDSFGILAFVVGTLASSAIAVVLAIPAGLGTAIFLTQVAPSKVAAPISLMMETLAGIPSIIYGFWGILVLGPFLVNDFEPELAQHLSFIPFLAGPVGDQPGLLAGGIILAIMILPIIASVSRDTMTRTPKELKEGARALGLTRWEVTRKIVLPYAKTAIVGSIVLGLGRALGETMAISMLLGARNPQLPTGLYSPISTIAAFMLQELGNASAEPTGIDTAALMELAIILLLITVTVNVVARLLMKHGVARSSENIVRV